MKQLLVLIFAVLPSSLMAQQWDVGLHAGVSLITDPKDWQVGATRVLPSPVVRVSAGRMIQPRIRLGVDVAATRLWRKVDMPLYDQNGQPIGTRINGRLCIGDLAVLISPSVSYKMANLYFGAQAGYAALTKGDYFRYADKNGKLYRNFNSGFFGGLHAGYERALAKAIALHVELRGNFVQVNDRNGGVLWNRAQVGQAQATVGVHYRF